jgi:hypothetical protein
MTAHSKINSRVAFQEQIGKALYDYNKAKNALEANYLALGFNPYTDKRKFLRKQWPVQVGEKVETFNSFITAIECAVALNGVPMFPINSI